jgi:hypothetical protein
LIIDHFSLFISVLLQLVMPVCAAAEAMAEAREREKCSAPCGAVEYARRFERAS